jgi:hypothetical protein
MADERDAEQIVGHCLCGGVRIAVRRPKHHVELCHCSMCRRWGGAFYAALTGESFTVDGEEAVTVFRSSSWAERAFCATCGSNLWFRFLPTGNRSFLAGLFSDADGFTIEREIFVDEKSAWCDTSTDHPRLTGEQVMAEARAAGFAFDQGA